jgi:hypothetical protein
MACLSWWRVAAVLESPEPPTVAGGAGEALGVRIVEAF